MISKKSIFRGSRFILGLIGAPLEEAPRKLNLTLWLVKNQAIVLIWNEMDPKGESYRCIFNDNTCDFFSGVSKNTRKNLKRALNLCDFRYVKLEEILKNGYPVYQAGSTRFSNYKQKSCKKFTSDLVRDASRNRMKYLAAYYQGKLIAFMSLIDSDQVLFGYEAYFDPEYSFCNAMLGLYRVASIDALKTGFKEFDRGAKPLVHETNIDEFLQKIGFELQPCTVKALALPGTPVAVFFLVKLLEHFPNSLSAAARNKIKKLNGLLHE